jgi:hypothetical protein
MLQFLFNNWFPFSTAGGALIALGAFRSKQAVLEDDVEELKHDQGKKIDKLTEDLAAVRDDVSYIRGQLEDRGPRNGRFPHGRSA